MILFVFVQCSCCNSTMYRCCLALFGTAEGHITRRLILSMEVGFCGNLGKASKERGLWDVSLQACMFGRAFHDIPESLSQPVVSQSANRRLRMSAQLPLVLVWWWGGGGGAISKAEICLNRTNCRLWAGQGWGTMDTLKIAHTLDKFREPTQVTSIFRLHHSVLSEKCLDAAHQ